MDIVVLHTKESTTIMISENPNSHNMSIKKGNNRRIEPLVKMIRKRNWDLYK